MTVFTVYYKYTKIIVKTVPLWSCSAGGLNPSRQGPSLALLYTATDDCVSLDSSSVALVGTGIDLSPVGRVRWKLLINYASIIILRIITQL